jgi:hypothetical protein
LLLVTIFITACNSRETETIKTNLGAFQYMGVDPQLSFSIPTAEFELPENEYSSVKAKFTVNIKQNNKTFPLNIYHVSATADVLDNQGTKREKIIIQGDVENGVVSVSGIDSIYGLKVKDQSELKSLKLQINSYQWFPKFELKPFEEPPTKAS